MSSPNLNDDVLLSIASFVDPGTLRSLMGTCPLLLEYGAKCLLSKGVVLDEDDARIGSFLSFMLKEGHSTYRIKLLQSLELSTPYHPRAPRPPAFPETTGMALAKLFRAIAADGDLRNLCLDGAEQLLGLHPDVSAAIAQLTTIELLEITNAGLRTINMLRSLRCPLKKTTISLPSLKNEIDSGILSSQDRNMVWYLYPFVDTLESLSMARSTSAPDGPVYPNVTYLSLLAADIRHVHYYVRTFPNLRILSTQDCGHRSFGEEPGPRRARNMVEQETFGTWASLTSYYGSTLTLYLLAIPKHIPKVVIKEIDTGLDSGMLRTVLGDAHPLELQLSIDGAFWLLDPDFYSVFTHHGVNALRHLQLVVKVDDLDDATDFPAALEAVIAHVIKPLRVTLVAVKIELDLCWYPALSNRRGPHSPSGDPEAMLEGWDIDAYAHRIQDEMGAVSNVLQSVTVALCNHRTRREDCQVTLASDADDHFHNSDEGEWCDSDDEEEWSDSESDGEILEDI